MYPLTFASTARVDVGSSAVTANMNKGSLIFWGVQTSNGATDRVFQRGAGNNRWYFSGRDGATNWGISRGRATTGLSVRADVTNYAAFALGKPLCLAGVWDTGGADADQLLWMGNLNMPLLPPSSYTGQTAGAGTPGDNSADTLFLGNTISPFGTPFVGSIWWLRLWPFVLRMTDMQQMARNPLAIGKSGDWVFGGNGTGVVKDRSGNNMHGTITGATLSNLFLPKIRIYG